MANPPPSIWTWQARLIIALSLPIDGTSATLPRAAYVTPGSWASISVIRIGIAHQGRVAAARRGGGPLAEERRRGHLAAGHAVDAVVDEDRGDALPTGRGMDDLRRPDGGQVAVALVSEDEGLRPDAADARGHGRGAAVRRLDEVHVEVVVGEDRATDRGHGDGVGRQVQLGHHLGQEAVDRRRGRSRGSSEWSGRRARPACGRPAAARQTAGMLRGHRRPPGWRRVGRRARSTFPRRAFSAPSTSPGVGTRPPIRPWKATGQRPSTASRTSSTICPDESSTVRMPCRLPAQSGQLALGERPQRDRAEEADLDAVLARALAMALRATRAAVP